MAKRVQVIIDGVTRYDGTPATFNISENESGSFQLRVGPQQGGLLEQLTGKPARRQLANEAPNVD